MAKSMRAVVGMVVLAVALALTACGGIPRSGPVRVGPPVTVDDELPLDFLPSGPAAGASPQDILLGFIEAALSPQSDFKTAHEFLTTNFGSSWKPLQNVTIYQGTPEVQQVNGNSSVLQLSVTPVAEVDADGEYSQVASSAPIATEYRFVKQAGEWRISHAPNGILLERLNFDQVFSGYPLYFFDPSYSYLVPDLRWFPARDFPSTRIVKAVLKGPADWLAAGNAVVSSFPTGTALSADTVPVNGRDARVDLNAEALNADTVTWQRMQVQLKRSLELVPSVSTVTISVNQNENETSELSIPAPRIDSRPLVYRNGEFGFLASTNDAVSRIADISDQVESVDPLAAVLGSGQSAAAVLGDGGVYAVRATQPKPVLVDDRDGLIPPTIDPFGFVWSLPEASPSDIMVFGADNSPHTVHATWPEASSIVSLDVSRDGTRVLALLDDSGVSRMVVAAIIRGDERVPTKLGEPIELSTAMGTPMDATWVDELNVMSMTRTKSGDDQLMLQQIGGPSESRGMTTGGVAVVGGNTLSSVRIFALLGEAPDGTAAGGAAGDSGGVLLTSRGTGWQQTASGISFLATQLGTR